MSQNIESFSFLPGRKIANKYIIESCLGKGWESEVYLIREVSTNIERAAKFFFPQRNKNQKIANEYAKKLHRMGAMPQMIQYFGQETIIFKGHSISCLISEYVDGEILSQFVSKFPGKRLHYFEGLNLVYEICKALEPMHNAAEYHGDLHSDNILVKRAGVGFNVKLIDPFDWRDSRKLNIEKDTFDLVRILHEVIGGQKFYSKMPKEVKAICCGLKTSLMRLKFKNATQLKTVLESIQWG